MVSYQNPNPAIQDLRFTGGRAAQPQVFVVIATLVSFHLMGNGRNGAFPVSEHQAGAQFFDSDRARAGR